MSDSWFLLSGLIASYLVGSIPSGYILGRYWLGIDVTRQGSGNIGATNFARLAISFTDKKDLSFYEWIAHILKCFFIIFFLDMGKAFFTLKALDALVSPYYSTWFTFDYLILCALSLFIGNLYSLFLGFMGGKGVATMLGVSFYLVPLPVILLFIIVWIVMVVLTGQVFFASLSAALSMVLGYLFFVGRFDSLFFFLVTIVAFVIVRHRSNIFNYLHSNKNRSL